MADPKVLTPAGWKTVSAKCKVQNNDLLKALAAYEKLAEDEHEALLECILEIKQLALELKKSKEAAANKDMVKYLADMIATAESEHKCVSKDKADYDKENMTRKKAEEAKKYEDEEEDDDEEEEEDGEYKDQLLAALQKLKGAKDVEYQFIVCEAKPHPCVMVARRISPKHKEQLTKITGSKRFLHVGTCKVQDGKYYFNMEKPASGLARKMQASIKYHTGKKFAINVGNEMVGEDEDYGPGEGDYAQPGGPRQGEGPLLNATDPDRRRGDPLLNATDPDRPKGGPLLNATDPDRPGGVLTISGSVGQGGKNVPADVVAVQNALNAKAKAGLKVDGKCGPKTIGAIIQFQKQMGMPKPDGRVDPGRGTARALSSAGPLPAPPPPPKPVAPPKLGKAELAKAPQIWHGMRQIVDTNIEQVKRAVKAHYAHEHPALIKEIDENLQKLDAITDKLDHRIAECLERAHAAKDEAARKAQLKTAKTILAEYIGYVKSEKLIAHVDNNPWVKIELRKTLVDHMTHMAQAIG